MKGDREVAGAIGRALRKEARKQGKTTVTLAEDTGLSQATISRILSGKTNPDMPSVMAILGALLCSLSWLETVGVVCPIIAWRCPECGLMRSVGNKHCPGCYSTKWTRRVWFGCVY